MTDPRERPGVEVVRGTPTPEELAALVAVVTEAYAAEAAAAVVEDAPAETTSAWTHARRLRSMPPRGSAWGRFRG